LDPTPSPTSTPTPGPSTSAPTKIECASHADCAISRYCDARFNCFPCVDRDGVDCEGHGDAIDGECPNGAGTGVADECNPSGTESSRPAAGTSGTTSDAGSAWTALLAVFGGTVLLGIAVFVVKTRLWPTSAGQSAARASSVANPTYDTSAGRDSMLASFEEGPAAYMDVAPVDEETSGYATVQGFARRGSACSTTHVQVGANDLYAGIPAESTYSELPVLDHGVATYMDVASTPVTQSGYVDVAPAQYGFGHDNGNNFEVDV